jgi:magnesium transporter
VREHLLSLLSSKEIATEIIDNLESDDATDVISELPEQQKEEVLSLIEDNEHASDISDLLNYEEDTAGGLMAKELIHVNDKWSILRCVSEMRKQAEDVDKVYTIYVVDDNRILLGTLSLKKLLLSPEKNLIKNIYNEKVISRDKSLKSKGLFFLAWDGTCNEENAIAGTYVFKVITTKQFDENTYEQKGYVNLIR